MVKVEDIKQKESFGFTNPADYNVYIEEPGEEIITVSENVKEDVIKIMTNNIFLYCSHKKIHGYMRTFSGRRCNTCIQLVDINGRDLYENTQYKLFDLLNDKQKKPYQLLFEKVINEIK